MEKRTAEIIMVLKGNHNLGEFNTYKEMLAAYMSDRCDYPAEDYTDEMLFGIVKEAVQDYMSGCTSPGQIRVFLYRYFEAHKWHEDELSQWLSALSLVQVREKSGQDEYRYINGFNDENTSFVCKRGKERFMVEMISDPFVDHENVFIIKDNKYNRCCVGNHGNLLTFFTEEKAEDGLKKVVADETQNLIRTKCGKCVNGTYCTHKDSVIYCEDYKRDAPDGGYYG